MSALTCTAQILKHLCGCLIFKPHTKRKAGEYDARKQPNKTAENEKSTHFELYRADWLNANFTVGSQAMLNKSGVISCLCA